MTAKNGKPCTVCGTSAWANNGNCIECRRERSRKWRQENPEKSAAHSRKWRQENPDRMLEYQRQWQKDNRNRSVELNRRWRRANPDKFAESGRQWRRSNPDKASAIKHRRRTRQTGAGGSYTDAEWQALCRRYGNKCLRCKRADVKLTADHIRPVSMGGSSNIENIQPLCGSCNSVKHNRHIDYRPDAGIARWVQAKLFG